jgi:Insulinase (Peptidase family M16)
MLQGVAHILEHLAFNATESWPNHELVRFLESIGSPFGACQNAYTTQGAAAGLAREASAVQTGARGCWCYSVPHRERCGWVWQPWLLLRELCAGNQHFKCTCWC